jgi:hypothetical protein
MRAGPAHPARAARGTPGAWAGPRPAAPPCRSRGSARRLRRGGDGDVGWDGLVCEGGGQYEVMAWPGNKVAGPARQAGPHHAAAEQGASLPGLWVPAGTLLARMQRWPMPVCSRSPAPPHCCRCPSPVWWFKNSATLRLVWAGSSACRAMGAITPPPCAAPVPPPPPLPPPAPSPLPMSMSATAVQGQV